MLDYDSIKEMAKAIGRPVKELLALSYVNDPFYAGVGHRAESAEWFADIWSLYGSGSTYLRRIHYRIISLPDGERILLPNGREYQNTERDWKYLCCASLAARYLDLVADDDLTDNRNNEAMIFAIPPQQGYFDKVATYVIGGVDADIPDMPILPFYRKPDIHAVQDCIVEVWIEKSTQNDWLVPLCRRRGVNLVVGIGEQSEIRSRELALRAADRGAPVRVIYISDFDPGGRSMPKAMARKAEFAIAKHDLDVDLHVIPLALTPDQCRHYELPRTPIKEKEKRKDKFERIFGVGATELDALEALHPGEMARLLEEEIDNFLDSTLRRRATAVASDTALRLRKIEAEVRVQHADAIEDLTERFEAITEALQDWEEQASELWEEIEADLEPRLPDLSGVEVPQSQAPGDTERFVLFDSRRDYFTQIDHYHAWRDGDE